MQIEGDTQKTNSKPGLLSDMAPSQLCIYRCLTRYSVGFLSANKWNELVETFSVVGLLSAPAGNSQRGAEMNCDWLSDRLTGCRGLPVTVNSVCVCVCVCARACACVRACFSAGLLCLRGGMCICGFFFSLCILFWTEAAVGSHLAQPPSHTEDLQYGSDVVLVRLLFVYPTLPALCGHSQSARLTKIDCIIRENASHSSCISCKGVLDDGAD